MPQPCSCAAEPNPRIEAIRRATRGETRIRVATPGLDLSGRGARGIRLAETAQPLAAKDSTRTEPSPQKAAAPTVTIAATTEAPKPKAAAPQPSRPSRPAAKVAAPSPKAEAFDWQAVRAEVLIDRGDMAASTPTAAEADRNHGWGGIHAALRGETIDAPIDPKANHGWEAIHAELQNRRSRQAKAAGPEQNHGWGSIHAEIRQRRGEDVDQAPALA